MTQVVVRLDPKTAQALDRLTLGSGASRSQAIRDAIKLAERERVRARLRADAAAVAADPTDRAEALELAEEMSERRAW
jgi:metal-responsive CopG/Arc/MetJ family transcriptional regulator